MSKMTESTDPGPVLALQKNRHVRNKKLIAAVKSHEPPDLVANQMPKVCVWGGKSGVARRPWPRVGGGVALQGSPTPQPRATPRLRMPGHASSVLENSPYRKHLPSPNHHPPKTGPRSFERSWSALFEDHRDSQKEMLPLNIKQSVLSLVPQRSQRREPARQVREAGSCPAAGRAAPIAKTPESATVPRVPPAPPRARPGPAPRPALISPAPRTHACA